MDIPALSIAINQTQIQHQASISIMKMAMNTAQQNNSDFIKMLEQSFQPHLGSSVDIKL